MSSTIDSKGSMFKTYSYYNYDIQRPSGYPAGFYSSLNFMNDNNWQYKLATENWRMTGANDSVMLGCSILTPKYKNGSGVTLLPNTLQWIATQKCSFIATTISNRCSRFV